MCVALPRLHLPLSLVALRPWHPASVAAGVPARTAAYPQGQCITLWGALLACLGLTLMWHVQACLQDAPFPFLQLIVPLIRLCDSMHAACVVWML